MAELADALDLGSSSDRSEGSSPFIRTCKNVMANPVNIFNGISISE